jgi:glycosyltransferase involved in cell wall biosynthesis
VGHPWRDACVRWYLGRVYAGQFDVHLANSEYTADELRGAIHPKHPREVYVVPMGVALDGFGPERRSTAVRQAIARTLGVAEPFHLLLYVGRLAREKNLTLLVETLARLGDREAAAAPIVLVVVGSGPLEADLAARLRSSAAGRACLWGQVQDRRVLAAFYASADVFVHPNPREPFGIAPLEAMASGLPLVAPREGGVLSYASDANAWLAAPIAEAMAAAVRRALVAGPEREGRLRAARRTAARFDWQRVCGEVFATYDAIHASRLSGASNIN